MTITIEIGTPELHAALARAPQAVERSVGFAIERAAGEVARRMKARAPKAFSTLANSIKPEKLSALAWRAGPNVAYAPYLEFGRAPGGRLPPVEAIEAWVKLRRLAPRNTGDTPRDVAWAIARTIQARGTPPRPFVQPTFDEMLERVRDLVALGVADGLKQAGLA